MSEQRSATKSGRGSKFYIAVGFGSVFAIVAIAYFVAFVIAGNKVPNNSSVEGIAVGGLGPQAAKEKLSAELLPKFARQIQLVSGQRTAQLDPKTAGLSIDLDSTLEKTGMGFSLSPSHLLRVFRGGGDISPVFHIDDEKLAKALQGVEPRLNLEPRDASVTLLDGKVVVTKAETGSKLEIAQTAAAVAESFRKQKFEVPVQAKEVEPTVHDAEVQTFVDGPLKKALSGSISLTAGKGSLNFSEADVAKMLKVQGSGAELKVQIDEQALATRTKDQVAALSVNKPKNASYQIQGGKVVVIPAQDGEIITNKEVLVAFQKAIAGPGRTVALQGQKATPSFATAEAEKLIPTQIIGEFTTRFPHSDYRNNNLGRAANTINGTVVLPGETFSMNGVLGERTEANGYVPGFVIFKGKLVKQEGGGISQVATTLYNAYFFAGMEDVEHQPHSLYFPRYPAGREATVYWGQLDLRFKNNTKYPVLIQGWIDKSDSDHQGAVHMRLWSRKTWDKVESSYLRRSNYQMPKIIVKKEPNCEATEGIAGFAVNYERLFYKDGKLVKTEPFSWVYDTQDEVQCKP